MKQGRFIGVALSVALVIGATGMTSWAKSPKSHPPGNNGTVKVDGVEWDDAPNNEPHPGCTFEIDFYNYDEGDLDATYEFALQAPSGSGLLESGSLFIGEDPNGGGTDLDGSTGPIDLSDAFASSGATAHPKQGYHVMLTVHAEGSIGADVKHKVYWVTGCTQSVGTGGGAATGDDATGDDATGGQGGKKSRRAGVSSTSAAAGPAVDARSAGAAAIGRAAAATPILASPAFTG